MIFSAAQAESKTDSPDHLLAELNRLKNQLSQKESWQENIKITIKMLELYDSLISRQSDQLRRFQNAPDFPSAPLSPAIQEMIDHRQTDLLDWMLEATEIRLDYLAWDPFWKMEISDRHPAEQTQILTQFLDQSAPYLRILDQSVAQLHSILEQDSREDWNERFGKTGFYDRVKRLQNSLILIKSKYCFFQACADSPPASDPSDRLSVLHQAMQPLHILIQQTSELESSLHRLWYSRLCRMAAKNDPACLQKERDSLATIENISPSSELYFPIQIESILCLQEMSPRDTGAILQKIECLKQSIFDKLSANPSLFGYAIQLAILEGKMQPSTAENSSQVSPSNPIRFSRLDPIKVLAQRFPQYQDFLADTMGIFLIHQLDNQEAPHLERWDPSDLLAAAQYGQTIHILHPRSLLLYETFLRSSPEHHPQYPLALYNAGLLYYQLAESLAEHPAESTPPSLAAVQHWNRLARQFPLWKSSFNQPEISSETALQIASAIACELYRNAPDTYQALAHETLELLVGQWNETTKTPSGPFSQSDFARQSRYSYALILLAEKQYNLASQWFNSVPEKDPNKPSARYYAIYAGKYHLDSNSISAAEKTALYTPWIRQLLDLIQPGNSSVPSNPERMNGLSANAVLLAVSLYLDQDPPKPEQAINLMEQNRSALNHLDPSNRQYLLYLYTSALCQCGRFDPAIELLSNWFQTKTPPSEWDIPILQRSVQTLLSSHQDLLFLHGTANYNTLQTKLTLAIPLAQAILSHPQMRTNDALSLPAHRALLEAASLYAAVQVQIDPSASSSSVLENTLKQASPILSFCQNHPQAADTLWLIRCQALLAFAKQDYAGSQSLWARIRQSTDPSQDKQSALDWWQARYFGFLCLERLGRSAEAAHSLSVLSKTYPIDQSPWKIPLRQLEQSLSQSQ